MNTKLIKPFTELYDFAGWKDVGATRYYQVGRQHHYVVYHNGTSLLDSGLCFRYHRVDGKPAYRGSDRYATWVVGGMAFFATDTDGDVRNDLGIRPMPQTLASSDYDRAVEEWNRLFGVDWLKTIINQKESWFIAWRNHTKKLKLRCSEY